VDSASVNLEAGSASVRWDTGAEATVSAVLAAVKKAGYEAKPVETTKPDHAQHRQERAQLVLADALPGGAQELARLHAATSSLAG
jgi:cation transport ATPase